MEAEAVKAIVHYIYHMLDLLDLKMVATDCDHFPMFDDQVWD